MITQSAVIATPNSQSSLDLEANLTIFIKKSIIQSYQEKPDIAMKLLDSAWEAQKLLWQVREQTAVQI